MSPMSEDDASLKKEKQRSTGSGGRKSKKDKDQAVKRSKAKEEKQKREEVKEDKPDLSQMPSFKGEVGRRERGAVKARAGSLSEDGASSDPGLAEPNCQPEHMPHPSPAQLRDKKYFARLQALHIALNNPATSGMTMDAVVEVVLETGNFSLDKENFNFDICNLDMATVAKIESVLSVKRIL